MTISLDQLTYYIAWFEWQGGRNEANALRHLASYLHPNHSIDEAKVQERLTDLHSLDLKPRQLDQSAFAHALGSGANVTVTQAVIEHDLALLWDAQSEVVKTRERERQLQEQINQLLRDLGHKEGELEALRASKPKSLWARLLGGGE